jgi:hypothetical protein
MHFFLYGESQLQNDPFKQLAKEMIHENAKDWIADVQ